VKQAKPSQAKPQAPERRPCSRTRLPTVRPSSVLESCGSRMASRSISGPSLAHSCLIVISSSSRLTSSILPLISPARRTADNWACRYCGAPCYQRGEDGPIGLSVRLSYTQRKRDNFATEWGTLDPTVLQKLIYIADDGRITMASGSGWDLAGIWVSTNKA
jgi:hypothetical protein